jgi:type VI secretion system protein ImpM
MPGGFGLFGKLPVKGDFLRLNLPPGFERPWDDWQQALLLAGREALGKAWQTRYLEAPIWRFTLAAGLAGEAPVLGVMAPSLDRVGRQFPLTLVARCAPDAPPLPIHLAAADVFDALEEIALLAVTEDTALEVLMEQLSGLDLPSGIQAGQAERRGAGFMCRGELAPALGQSWLASMLETASLWTAVTPGQQDTHLICAGLPEVAAAKDLFAPAQAAHDQHAGQGA